MYDCDEILVRKDDLIEQGLEVTDLQDFYRLVDNHEIKQLINQSKHCVNF